MNPLAGMALATLFFSLLLPPQAQAQTQTYHATVSRKGNNIYHIDGKGLVVVTVGCSIQAYAENTLLTSNGAGGEITFTYSKDKCEVRGVYGPIPSTPGRYRVTVSQKGDNWFEVFGTNTFLKTRECRVMVLGEEAWLQFPGTGPGRLSFKSDDQCTVEAVYGKKKL